MNYQNFDNDVHDSRGLGSGSPGQTCKERQEAKLAASLDSRRIQGAVLHETISLTMAAQDADPTLVHANRITLRAMAPDEAPETLCYSLHLSTFGQLLVASSSEMVCHITFVETQHSALKELRGTFPYAQLQQEDCPMHQMVLAMINGVEGHVARIVLNMPGTAFQHRVWAALLHIPKGALVNYGQIARFIGQPKSARAVGMAISANKAAFLVPCHRVVRRSGEIGGFMWGAERKMAMIAAEIGGGRA